jgi:plasmid stability protein
MKTMTIHGLDNEVEKLIKKRAKSAGASVNKTVKELLTKAVGLGDKKKDNRDEFLDLFGAWTEEEEKAFNDAIKDLEAVSLGDWK